MSRTKSCSEEGWEVNQVRGFLQREEKANRAERKIRILLIKPWVSSISYKKKRWKSFSSKEEIPSSHIPEILKSAWRPRWRGAVAELVTPSSCLGDYLFTTHPHHPRAQCAGPGAPGAGKLLCMQAKPGAGEMQDVQEKDRAYGDPRHSVPLSITNRSFALGESPGKSWCQLQLKTITPTQSCELITGNPKSPLCVFSVAVPLSSPFWVCVPCAIPRSIFGKI